MRAFVITDAVARAQQIAGIDGEVIDDFDARVETIMKDGRITVWHWKMYTDFLEGKGAFGIKDEATFFSDVLGKEVTRYSTVVCEPPSHYAVTVCYIVM